MKFRINRTRCKLPLPEEVTNIQQETDYDRKMGYGYGEIQIDTLEQLLAFCRKADGDLILSCSGDDFRLEIYDDYRE